MSSNSFRLRYGTLPGSYTRVMKTLTNSLKIEVNDPARFRLKVLEHAGKHGISSALSAYGISRRTYYYWLSSFNASQGKLVSLVPKSTKPEHTRRMEVDERLVALIRCIREKYGRVGKEKLKILVNAYADSLGIKSYSAGKIGKIIKRNNYFFDPPKQKHKLRFQRSRVRRVGKVILPGYLEMDSVIVWANGMGLRLLTVVDIVTKVAYARRVKSGAAIHTIGVLKEFTNKYHIPLHTIQTDNGSEFLGDFHTYIEERNIHHLFIYPRCPRVNGVVERFNRTIQEECVERYPEWQVDPEGGDQNLTKYLNWYNATRPHAALNYLTPLKYAEQFIS